LKKGMQKTGAKKVISYHDTIAAADEFAEEARKVLVGLTVVHVNGEQSGPERREHMGAFGEAERALATNMKCLTEGIDVPDVDMVAFMAPKNSSIDIVQAVGRAQRRHPGKRVGYVLLPLLLDTEAGETVEEAVARKKMQTVWRVVAAMMNADPLFAEAVQTRARQIGRGLVGMNPTGPSGTGCAEPVGAGPDLAPTEDIPFHLGGCDSSRDESGVQDPWPVEVVSDDGWSALQAAIDVSIVKHVGDSWDEWFGLLESYAKREGNARVPLRHEENGRKLGTWVLGQRESKDEGRLAPDRIAKLSAVTGWSWSVLGDNWESWYNCLKAYVARTGNARPAISERENGKNIGIWVAHQRKSYADGNLDPERADRLAALEGWSWSALEDAWDDMLKLLVEYFSQHGASPVPRYRSGNHRLGAWVSRQRQLKARGMLSPERIAKLAALPCRTWDPLMDNWEKGFALLQSYKLRVGSARYPNERLPEAKAALTWVQNQRRAKIDGRLTAEKIARLESIPGFSWSPHESLWEESFLALQQYVARTQTARVPHSYCEGERKLGMWVSDQRKAKRSGRLSPDRIARLEALPDWAWDARKEKAA
jgi:hypothetical protein